MSCLSSQGVGAAPCANAPVEKPARMATVKTVFVEMHVIIHPPREPSASVPRFEQITNGIAPSIATFDASHGP
jgi:hypothetical protein